MPSAGTASLLRLTLKVRRTPEPHSIEEPAVHNYRSLLVGTGRLFLGLVLLNASVEALDSQYLRRHTSSTTTLNALRAQAEGVLKDIASMKSHTRT
jgi:hypothetical protein